MFICNSNKSANCYRNGKRLACKRNLFYFISCVRLLKCQSLFVRSHRHRFEIRFLPIFFIHEMKINRKTAKANTYNGKLKRFINPKPKSCNQIAITAQRTKKWSSNTRQPGEREKPETALIAFYLKCKRNSVQNTRRKSTCNFQTKSSLNSVFIPFATDCRRSRWFRSTHICCSMWHPMRKGSLSLSFDKSIRLAPTAYSFVNIPNVHSLIFGRFVLTVFHLTFIVKIMIP